MGHHGLNHRQPTANPYRSIVRSARRAAAAIQLLTLTVDVYGGWERKAEKAEAEWLEGAFPVGARISARTVSSPEGAVRGN